MAKGPGRSRGLLATALVALAVAAMGCRDETPQPPGPRQETPSDPAALFPVTGGPFGERWGYIDRQGRPVIGPRFGWAGRFEGPHAPVHVDSQLLIIDRRGEVRLSIDRFEGQFALGRRMGDGLIPVRREGKWGCLDLAGRLAIPAAYDQPLFFHDGLAVAVRDGKAGFIDRDGKVVIELAYASARPFSDGLAAVQTGGRWQGRRLLGGQWGFINRSGETVIKPAFALAHDFHDGRAATYSRSEDSPDALRFDGYIDRDGQRVISGEDLARPGPFAEGLAAVRELTSGRYGYINRHGEFVIEPRFARAARFVDGLAAVQPADDNPEGTWGYINARGEFVIPPQFAKAGDFREGLAAVLAGSGVSPVHINRQGLQVWPPAE